MKKKTMKINEICIFLHKHCMKHGGEYAKNGRRIGDHLGVALEYIAEYIEHLDRYYQGCFINEQSLTSIYFNLESIHPFSDANGRIGKVLIALLSRNKTLCKYLSKLQQTHLSFEDKINNNVYFENIPFFVNTFVDR